MATSRSKSTAKTTGKAKRTNSSSKSVKSKTVKAGTQVPTEDDIRAKAKDIYNERIIRGQHGTADEDWHEAERLLRHKKR
jgi:hypothetical protein